MIPNQWYAVLESSEVPNGKPIGVTRMGEKLVFWRDTQGKLSCLRDICPHRGVALSLGKLQDDTLECPFHGFRYDASGSCCLIPANGRSAPVSKFMKVFCYPTYEAHGFIFIWWGKQQEDLPPPRFFDDIDETMTYATSADPWNAHYARVIENQLDVAHVPFIHYNTIGRGGRTLVDGPLIEWQDVNRFKIYTFNRLDDGSRPRKPKELSRPGTPFHLDFIFPNLWQNYISDNVRVLAAFTPVDNEHTILYLRFYQNFMRVPLLKGWVSRLAMPFNVFIAHQDRVVVETQLPKRPMLKMGEKLIQADNPIVAYRVRRAELLQNDSNRAANNTGISQDAVLQEQGPPI
jgi:phenylpropionate dioxygenase-like ring-hydroxylating dioxygenase large terminal subunit